MYSIFCKYQENNINNLIKLLLKQTNKRNRQYYSVFADKG